MIKWSFAKLKEEHLIGKRLFSPGFCGKLFTLIYLEIFFEKTKKSYTNMSNRLTSIKWYYVCVFLCSISRSIQQKTSTLFIRTPDIASKQEMFRVNIVNNPVSSRWHIAWILIYHQSSLSFTRIILQVGWSF